MDHFQGAIPEYTEHLNHLRRGRIDAAEAKQKELDKLERDRIRMVEAIKNGVPSEMIKEDAERIATRMFTLKSELAAMPTSEPILHPATADVYSKEVRNLITTLNDPDHRPEAAEILRGLISKIVLTPAPSGDRLMVDLEGDLAGILAIADGTQPQSGLTPAKNKTLEIDMTLASAIYRLPEGDAQGVVGKAGCGSRI